MSDSAPVVPAAPSRDQGVGEIFTTLLLCMATVLALAAFAVPLFIVPKFKAIFYDFGSRLPATTEWLIHTSDLARQLWFLSIPLFAAPLVIGFVVTWKVNWRGGLLIGVAVCILSLVYAALTMIALFMPLIQIIQDVRSRSS